MNTMSRSENFPGDLPDDKLRGLLDFLQAAEQLKDTLRSGATRNGRPESTAEHSWRLALMVLVFERELRGIDVAKLLKLCIVHDLGEAISGDIPAPLQRPDDDREKRERRDFQALCKPLPAEVAADLLLLWDEYAAAETPEARMAKGFDKLETMLQHQMMPRQDAAFYEFNLTYGTRQTDFQPLTRQIRQGVDAGTRAIMEGDAEPGFRYRAGSEDD